MRPEDLLENDQSPRPVIDAATLHHNYVNTPNTSDQFEREEGYGSNDSTMTATESSASSILDNLASGGSNNDDLDDLDDLDDDCDELDQLNF